MSDTEDDGYEPAQMTRRQALKGGSAAAVAAGSYLLQQQLVQRAAAQTNEPRIQLGSDWVIDDDPDGNGALMVEHTPNGNQYVFNENGNLAVSAREVANLGARGVQTSEQSIPDTTVTTLNIDAANFEHTDIVTADTANDQLVIQRAGIYMLTGAWASATSLSDGTRVQLQVRVNGTPTIQTDIPVGGSAFPSWQSTTTEQLSQGDVLTLTLWHNEGTSINVGGSDETTLVALMEG